jgi:hypothetical protein
VGRVLVAAGVRTAVRRCSARDCRSVTEAASAVGRAAGLQSSATVRTSACAFQRSA